MEINKDNIVYTKEGSKIKVIFHPNQLYLTEYNEVEGEDIYGFVVDSKTDHYEIMRFLNIFYDIVSGKYTPVLTEDVRKIILYNNLKDKVIKMKTKCEKQVDLLKTIKFESMYTSFYNMIDEFYNEIIKNEVKN